MLKLKPILTITFTLYQFQINYTYIYIYVLSENVERDTVENKIKSITIIKLWYCLKLIYFSCLHFSKSKLHQQKDIKIFGSLNIMKYWKSCFLNFFLLCSLGNSTSERKKKRGKGGRRNRRKTDDDQDPYNFYEINDTGGKNRQQKTIDNSHWKFMLLLLLSIKYLSFGYQNPNFNW